MESSKKPMSLVLAKMYMDANQIVHSGVPARTLEHVTHLNHTTVSRIRNNVRSLDEATLRTCLRLSAYPKSKVDFDTDELWSIFAQVLDSMPVSHLSKLLSIPRITLQRLKHHDAKLLNTNISFTISLVDFYDNHIDKRTEMPYITADN